MFNIKQLKIGDIWQVSGRILEIEFIDDKFIYFDNGLILSLDKIESGNYMELKIS